MTGDFGGFAEPAELMEHTGQIDMGGRAVGIEGYGAAQNRLRFLRVLGRGERTAELQMRCGVIGL